MSNMNRLEELALGFPEAARVDIEAWDGEPTFRVRGKNFVFSDPSGTRLTLKLTSDEAAAAVASEAWVEPASYGLGRHGWVVVTLDDKVSEDRWQQVAEWVHISYGLVAPKRLAQLVSESAPTRNAAR